MLKKTALCLAVLATIVSLSNTNVMAEDKNPPTEANQQNTQSPFLITSDLPHLTKLLIQQWDNPALQLTEEQKTQLLVIRKETIAGVRDRAPQIASLEKQVTEGIFTGKTPEELHATVQTIAKMKRETTMIQLQCIYDTNKILNQKQLDILLAK